MSPLAWVLSGIVRLYRTLSRPFPSPCRFSPTCSAYALEAITVHGAARGSWLAVRRIARCHPFNPGGVDPVPPPRERPLRVARRSTAASRHL